MQEYATISAQWAEVVEKIRRGDESGARELYGALTEGVRAGLAQSVPADSVDDRLHEVVVIVLDAIRGGEIRDPDRLMGFVKTVARRRAIAHIRGASFERRRFVEVSGVDPRAPMEESPELCAARHQQLDRVRIVLKKLCARDREIMERFYFLEQSPREVCAEMSLTATQFRLFKSRALARCLELALRLEKS